MGIYRAPNEVVFKTIELFLICIATGFSIMHILDAFYRDDVQLLLVFGQVVDIAIMFSTKPYIYFS